VKEVSEQGRAMDRMPFGCDSWGAPQDGGKGFPAGIGWTARRPYPGGFA